MPSKGRLLGIFILSLLMLLPLIPVQAASVQDVIVLCYHDVGNDKTNAYTVSKEVLREHLRIIKAQGYTPISIEQYRQARQGAGLPDKPVMITFDDGYRSFYSDVYPLLKEYGYPAVLSVVTSWELTGPPRGVGPIVSWEQLREMEASGLVAVASHTHGLHRQVNTNVFGDAFSAAVALEYKNGVYEAPEVYRNRVVADLQLSQTVMSEKLGHPVTILTWPYGEYSQVAVAAARQAGFEEFLTLGDDVDTELHRSFGLRRTIIYGNPGEKEFLQVLAVANKKEMPRMAQLDLDYLYDLSPVRFEDNIETAIYLMLRAKINTVVLQAFADDKGNGDIEQVYFYTQNGPVKVEVYSHVVQRLRAAGLKVYAWMPTLACQWLLKDHPEDAVQAIEPKNAGWYRRASPFSPRVQESLKRLFRDFAAYNPPIDGILFQDDLYLNDFEDTSPAAKAVFRARFNRDMTPEALKDAEIQREWTRIKTEALNKLTMDLADEVKIYRPQVLVARNIYAAAVTDPKAKTWLAQDYNEYLKLYDYTVIMAYPYLEKADNPTEWLQGLAQAALVQPEAKAKVIFKLQTYDWSKNKWVSVRELDKQAKALKAGGASLIGYYPLNVFSSKDDVLPQ